MDSEDNITHLEPPTPKGKAKKERTPAQKEATAKALEALQRKRKENWETKKKELTSAAPQQTKPPIKSEAGISEKPAPKIEKVEKPKDEMPEWAKALSSRIDALADYQKPEKSKKKKVIIEESSDSEEEVIVRRKKKDKDQSPPPPPPAPAPAPVAPPDNSLRRMLYRR
jgi:hypothetical protein